jgi:hypothetical protein
MTIYGVSQSSGVERRLEIEYVGHGIVLLIRDHKGSVERGRILIETDALLTALTDAPPGGSTVEGVAPPMGPKMLLDVEVRRNEVQLRARDGSAAEADVAVGLDDFQDALEKVIKRE